MIARLAFALLLVGLSVRASAQDRAGLRLILPVDCRPGVDCFVQNYVDAEPGPKARDFACGYLSYNGHKGTDIRVETFADMRRGVAVVAAADGKVRAIRDEMPDAGMAGTDPELLKSRECGNGVLLNHRNGWSTQYCHMKLGTIKVRPGQSVRAGELLGEIGYSGKSTFPHLHLTVRQGRKVIDPYTGRSMEAGCGAATQKPLWADGVLASLAYRPSGLLGAGFAPGQPTKDEISDGKFRALEIDSKAPILAFWTEVFGLREGDVEKFRIFDARGKKLVDFTSEPSSRHRARQFRFVAKRRRGNAWPRGRYRGEYRLLRRNGAAVEEVLTAERTVTVR